MALLWWLVSGTGCAAPVVLSASTPNPLPLPPVDRDVLWTNLVDVVDDYFQIEREQRVQQVGNVLTEGRIDTYPVVGATIFEPWRGDSANLQERWEATLQSIRRRATLRVVPTGEGYLVDVLVLKELEDVPRPEHATAPSASLRNDSALWRFTVPPLGQAPTAGWILLGRDPALEQRIIDQLQARFMRMSIAPARLPPVPAPQIVPR